VSDFGNGKQTPFAVVGSYGVDGVVGSLGEVPSNYFHSHLDTVATVAGMVEVAGLATVTSE